MLTTLGNAAQQSRLREDMERAHTYIDIVSKALQRKHRSLSPNVAKDDVRLDAEHSFWDHPGVGHIDFVEEEEE